MVDRERTTSFLGRLSFSWAAHLFKVTAQVKDTKVDDLPELDYETRAKTLLESFGWARGKINGDTTGKPRSRPPLWKILLISNRTYLIIQFFACVACGVVAFAPHFSLLNILRLLEQRTERANVESQLWMWVAGLGISIVVSSYLDNWLYFIALNKVSVRVLEQICIMVFDKAMRLIGSSNPVSDEDGDSKEKDTKENSTSTQNTINLVAVDGLRISQFAGFFFNLFLAPTKLVIACVMLQKLLDWRSLLAGLANVMILMPLVSYCMKNYLAAGSDLMDSRDRKMAVLTEALQGIRQIKFSALESKWEERLNELRKDELNAQKRVFLWDTGTMSLYIFGPIAMSIACLSVYAVLHSELTASVAFTAVSILNSIEYALSIIPELLTELMDALVSMRRIDKFFDSAEKEAKIIPSETIRFTNATIAWPGTSTSEGTPWALKNLNLSFPPGRLSIISGRTGSGKSLLLASVLGECEILNGSVEAPALPHYEHIYTACIESGKWIIESAVAYVASIPWIEAATIRDNIIFGLPFDAERYNEVLFACALTKDLEILTDGEMTEVGPSGVNLSGGQKARISLARALYSRAGILILDDIFSAVDVHTARHLYEHALTGKLAEGRTRILATHHIGMCLPKTEYVIYLNGGKLTFAGGPVDLQENGILGTVLTNESEYDESEDGNENTGLDGHSKQNGGVHKRKYLEGQINGEQKAREFVEKEQLRTNISIPKLFGQYVKASGSWPRWALLGGGYAAYTSLSLSRSWWVNIWSGHDDQSSYTKDVNSRQDPKLGYYLGIYIAFAASEWIMGSLRSYFVFMATLKASRSLFEGFLHTILRAPLRWLDTVPVGRILNRFSADFNLLDSRLGFELMFMLMFFMECMGVLIAGIIVSPVLIGPAAALILACLFFARKYLSAAREMRRLESVVRSPIYEQFNSNLSGLWTIRAFGKAEISIQQMQGRIDGHARAWWNLCLLSRWLGFRMNAVGAVFGAILAAFVTSRPGINASVAGFAISFTLQLTSVMTSCIRLYTNIELDMNAVDRVLEYSNIKQEAYEGIDPPAAWPVHGRLEVRDLTIQYASDLPPVLKGLNFSVQGNQRIGIVGRTGAGKSTLALALFRFLEAHEGQILVDGLDISKVKLHHLRSRLAIIPQNPVLFSGTVRSNLDPFNEHDDSELLSALSNVHWMSRMYQTDMEEVNGGDSIRNTSISAAVNLEGDIQTTPKPLEAPISQGGLNLSQGQRQLLCLARAIIANPKILVLDEATSAVDRATDELIQQTLRSEFGRNSTTLLVIAHRLSTIADFDRVLVLDDGMVVEFGHPRDLMQINEGVFRGMVESDSEKERLVEIIS
ncbi:transporter [Aspergillus sclerotialis]|uniref:Transporter n=1 Tax=Aspergillus sclerotialis TaxID=2070753 RepID=A0A3A2ZWT0_9EURO|nr:transporter [Aspergillus sclerotialis]